MGIKSFASASLSTNLVCKRLQYIQLVESRIHVHRKRKLTIPQTLQIQYVQEIGSVTTTFTSQQRKSG
jgi:hypothetical protein